MIIIIIKIVIIVLIIVSNNGIERRKSRYFTIISSQRREVLPTHTLTWPVRNRVQISCNTSGVYHVQLAVCRVVRRMFVGCLTSQQQASVSQGRICTDNFTCCHTEIEVADPTFYLTQSQYTNTWPTIPSADPITPGAWQGSHWSVNV